MVHTIVLIWNVSKFNKHADNNTGPTDSEQVKMGLSSRSALRTSGMGYMDRTTIWDCGMASSLCFRARQLWFGT